MSLPTNFEEQLTANLKKLVGVMPVGTPWWGFDPKAKPAGVQLYSGQLLARSSYETHWGLVSSKRTVLSESEWQAQVSTNGFCPYYSSGDGSTTYRMPLIKGVHPEFVAALAEAGQYKEAGLPNIEGAAYASMTQGILLNDGVGAFYGYSTGRSTNVPSVGGSYSGNDTWAFAASRSNPIYGNSDTVQPPSVTCVLGEYVVGSVATLGEANAESLLASVTQLESGVGALEGLKSGSGFNATGKAAIVGWGMPDYSATISVVSDIDLPTSYSYTAPSTGMLIAHIGNWSGANVKVYVNATIVLNATETSSAYGASFDITLLLSKGDVYKFTKSSDDNIKSSIFFVPLKGA